MASEIVGQLRASFYAKSMPTTNAGFVIQAAVLGEYDKILTALKEAGL